MVDGRYFTQKKTYENFNRTTDIFAARITKVSMRINKLMKLFYNTKKTVKTSHNSQNYISLKIGISLIPIIYSYFTRPHFSISNGAN